tara:strand:+ start:8603 stop:8872 length:270 start_codon:yes stop_codon:yes gene_type:complete
LSVWIGCEIRPYSFVKTRCFSDIEDPSLCGFEQINTRLLGEVSRTEVDGHRDALETVAQKGNPVKRRVHATNGMIDEGEAGSALWKRYA